MRQIIYVTDFGEVRLTANFVEEAEARWPGVEEYQQWNEEYEDWDTVIRPNWDGPIAGHMLAAVIRSGCSVVNSLSEIGL